MVGFPSDYATGTIVISQTAHKLYFVLDQQSAIAYPVAVARLTTALREARRRGLGEQGGGSGKAEQDKFLHRDTVGAFWGCHRTLSSWRDAGHRGA